MKIKHHDIEILEETPFANCKLEREPYARVLTDIVNTYADGFVLAINNEWGTGKTTFVKMWQQHLKNENFQTIYFNAWENDFDSNPLVALMSELKTLTKANNQKIFKSVVEKGAVLAKNVVPALAKSLIKKYVIDVDEIALDAVENTAKGATEVLEEQIKDYANKKKTIQEFRTELEKFIQKSDNNKPLVFIIDELDRCRPTYAVEILEQLKHFFSVSGIVFVLSIDKNHLASSVKGYYGSSEINTDEYLRRFIDLEYNLPKPSIQSFVNYLTDYYSFKDFFSSQQRINFQELRNDFGDFIEMTDLFFLKSKITLRQQERILSFTRLVLCSFNVNQYVFPNLLFILIYLKVMNNDFYLKIDRNEFSLQELSDAFTDFIIPITKDNDRINLLYIEALLLWFYNNNKEYHSKETLYARGENDELTTPIKSKLPKVNHNLADYFLHIDRQRYDSIKLEYLLNKINLTEPLKLTSSI